MEKTVRIANFTYHADAALLIGRLEAEEIQCFLTNEHLVNANPLLSNAVGGIDVTVRESDYEKALHVMKEVESNKQVSPGHDKRFEGYRKVVLFCPNCDSANSYRKKQSFFSFGAADHLCADCFHSWRE